MEDVWEKRFPSLQTLCKEPKLKEFQFKLLHRTVVTRRELFVMVSNQMMIVYIEVKKAPLTILLSTVFLLKNFHKRLSVGSM